MRMRIFLGRLCIRLCEFVISLLCPFFYFVGVRGGGRECAPEIGASSKHHTSSIHARGPAGSERGAARLSLIQPQSASTLEENDPDSAWCGVGKAVITAWW